MAEDFTTYTEKDDNNRATKTTTRITVASMPSTEDVYIYKDKTVGFYDGDFTFVATVNLTAADADGRQYVWMVANLVDDAKGIDDASGDYLACFLYGAGSSVYNIYLEECDGGAIYQDSYVISLNTPYYLKITRDETIGTYGTLYCYIYSDAARTALLDTLSITLRSSKKDFRYLYGLNNRNSGVASRAISGYSENLGSYTADPGYANTYPSVATTRVTSITHRYNRGVYNMELGLGDIISDFGIPRVDTGAGKSYEAMTFQEKMEATAQLLEKEAGMSKGESLRISRKLETIEEMSRREQKDISPSKGIPTREEFWRVYPGEAYPYGGGGETSTPSRTSMPPKPAVTPEEEAQIIKDIGLRLWNKLKGQQ